jgi:tetratricopeptide (TPR) repeat protein
MGSLKASTGKAAEAEKFYKTALSKNEGLLAARENLAQLISQQRSRVDEAVALWRENLKRQPDFLPSRLSLAAALEGKGDAKGAVEEYRAISAAQPNYLAARLALAGALQKAGDAEGAAAALKAALALEPSSSMIFERIGDLEKARNRTAEAAAAYESALKSAPDNQVRKRIRAKMKGAGTSTAKR